MLKQMVVKFAITRSFQISSFTLVYNIWIEFLLHADLHPIKEKEAAQLENRFWVITYNLLIIVFTNVKLVLKFIVMDLCW